VGRGGVLPFPYPLSEIAKLAAFESAEDLFHGLGADGYVAPLQQFPEELICRKGAPFVHPPRQPSAKHFRSRKTVDQLFGEML
jgi:hypothetical protein